MSDVVVCLPKSFRWGGHRSAIVSWFAEGGAPGQTVPAGTTYHWTVASAPRIAAGERVYVTHDGMLLGYAPLLFMQRHLRGRRVDLVRGGGAVFVTLRPESIRRTDRYKLAFQGYRYTWWSRSDEVPYTAQDLVVKFPQLARLPAFAALAAGGVA